LLSIEAPDGDSAVSAGSAPPPGRSTTHDVKGEAECRV
jgi:hypothetical protein